MQVGWAYFAGEGMERSVEDAAEWFEKASDKGHSKAMRQVWLKNLDRNSIRDLDRNSTGNLYTNSIVLTGNL